MSTNAMATTKKTSIEQWIDTALHDEDFERKCSAISLVHKSASGSDTEIKTTKIGEGGRSWSAKDLAEFMVNMAKTYCQDLAGVHTFMLLAFYGTNEPRLRHPFLLGGQYDNNGLGTEAPTPDGMRMQGMRHQEALIQGMFTERAMLLDGAFRMMRAQNEHMNMVLEHNKVLQKENMDAVNLAKETVLSEAARRAEITMSAKKFERETKDREMLMRFAPIVLNQLVGREIVPQSVADTALIDAIADNITADGAQKLVDSGILPPEVMGVVMARFNSHLEKKRRLEEEALARGSEADTDADDDPVLTEGSANESTPH